MIFGILFLASSGRFVFIVFVYLVTAALMRESHARGGRHGFLRAMTGKHRPADVPSFIAVTYHAELGEKDEAIAELNNAYENREIFLPLKVDPRLDSLRDDPRFTDLLRRVGLKK